MLVFAHFGHWLIGLAFGAPALLVPLGLVILNIVDRRREREEQEAGTSAG